MNRSNPLARSLATLSVVALAGSVLPPGAARAAIIQINEETTANYVETDANFTLVLTGTRVDDDRNSPIALGTDWSVNLVLTLDNNGDGDSVLLTGNIFHKLHPAGDPHGPGGPSAPVNIADSILGAATPPMTLNFLQRTMPHEEHWDKYTQGGTWAITGNQIESWSITITGAHAFTPTPGTAALLGLAGLAGARRRRA